jgi:hypothetical protein
MTKHCVQCGAVHEKRGYFCDPACHKAYRKAKSDERAKKKCRLCGRPLPHGPKRIHRKHKPTETEDACAAWGPPELIREFRKWQKEQRREGPVRSEHSTIQEPMGV